jgi:NAD(P)-dependent dehydrogenase (short-subunit alcohol dehydrogenase family)
MKIIRGKKALVTGAASGIGRALALGLAREGADLYLLDVDQPGVEAVAAEARALGVEAIAARCDLTQKDQITAAVKLILDRWGRVEILVNNAGVAYYGPTENMTAEQWNWIMSINLLAPLQFIHELLPSMLRLPEAHILNVCSISGLVASSRFAAYNVSKFGLIGMTEALRMEYGRRTLGATALCPGPVKTNLYRSAASGRSKPVPEPPGWLCASAERVAAKGIRGIKKNQRMVLVTPMAYGLYYIKRIAPWFFDRLARLSRKKKKPPQPVAPPAPPAVTEKRTAA